MSPTLQGKHVLVAEDDAAARRPIVKTLRAMGLDVHETTDGGRMLVALAGHYKGGRKPQDLDLIVTDVQMPVVDGWAVFHALESAEWSTPIIIVTAFDSAEVRAAAARLDAVVLPKPLDLDVLEETVRSLLSRKRR